MAKHDYTLTIDEVSKRLNKSVRTIHRYKDSGRLSFQVGTTQGNPLFFSRSEVEALARELYPHMAQSPPILQDGSFWERLERVEKLLVMLEHSPVMGQLLAGAGNGHGRHDGAAGLDTALQAIEDLNASGQELDRRKLGEALIRLGTTLSKA